MSCTKVFIRTLAWIALVGWSSNRAVEAAEQRHVILAGGCFWCMEKPFEELEGVSRVVAGYSGGETVDPSYDEVSAGGTGHREVVRVSYDPAQISIAEILEVFWHNIDPLDSGGQFCDRGQQYTSAVYYETEEQKAAALESRTRVADELGANVATEIVEASTFYPAEDYHQDYYREHAIKYRFYRWSCGRDRRLEELWGES